MCGLVGVFSRNVKQPVSRQVVAAMPVALSLISHRGPDKQQLGWIDGKGECSVTPMRVSPPVHDVFGVLGHARLSIIDLSEAANQPMMLADKPDLWMIYNGEIYNFKQLRQELESKGYRFQTDSDSEVVLALYDANMLDRLNGMFALAIWDKTKNRLFLARDRYGIKPLYYTFLSSGELAFSSELKSLLCLPGCSRAVNPRALHQHLTFQNVLTDETLLESVFLLPPAHWAVLDCNTGEFKTEKYWEPVFFDPVFSQSRLKAQADELRQRLEAAVASQLVGDVPLGSFLSGGIDTGAITTFASHHHPQLQTFTCGFDIDPAMTADEQFFDERVAARALANRLGTRHHEMTLSSGVLSDLLPSVVWHLDDFRAGISYQNYLVSALVAKDVTVVLSGVGGDELFAGYPWRYQPVMELNNAAEFEAAYYRQWVRLLSDERKNSLFQSNLKGQLAGYSSRDVFNDVLSGCQAEHPLSKALCFDMKTFLRGLLVVEDRLSMAHSLESRVPFLDNELVDFCLTLPAESKLQMINVEPVSKFILKEALKGILPEEVINRRKQGFTPPEASWMRTYNKRFVEETLLSEKALARGWFEPAALRGILQEHFEGRANHRFLIWSLLCFEWWQRLLLDPAIPVAPVRAVSNGVQSIKHS